MMVETTLLSQVGPLFNKQENSKTQKRGALSKRVLFLQDMRPCKGLVYNYYMLPDTSLF